MNDISVIEKMFGDLTPYRDGPNFYMVQPDQYEAVADTAFTGAKVRTIGHSAGNRPIISLTYGPHEPLDNTMSNLQSALHSGVLGGSKNDRDEVRIFPPCFFGTRRREHPVLVLQGAIHGGELGGTAAGFNLCRIIETGKDLRGRAWPQLAELARATRIVFIPWLNPDGTARELVRNPAGAPAELIGQLLRGVAKDGSDMPYPDFKTRFPIDPASVAYMGTYFNDAGVNLQYDFCQVERQPETRAWMQCYLEEKPDAVLNYHTDAGSMLQDVGASLPQGYQAEAQRIGAVVQQRMAKEGFKTRRLSWTGKPDVAPVLNQNDAIWHVCGALPLLCEMPAGFDYRPMTLDEIVDIGLIALEELLYYAHTDGLRPYEVWSKVRYRLWPQNYPDPGK